MINRFQYYNDKMDITFNNATNSISAWQFTWRLAYAVVFAAIISLTAEGIFNQIFPPPLYPEAQTQKACEAFGGAWEGIDRFCAGEGIDTAISQYFEKEEKHRSTSNLMFIALAVGAIVLSQFVTHLSPISYGLIATGLILPFRTELTGFLALAPPALPLDSESISKEATIGYLLALIVLIIAGWWEPKRTHQKHPHT